jgi:hypothetical protein
MFVCVFEMKLEQGICSMCTQYGAHIPQQGNIFMRGILEE